MGFARDTACPAGAAAVASRARRAARTRGTAMTARGTLAADVRRFADEQIDGPEQLEILLFLHRNPAKFWDAARVAETLALPERAVADDLETLARRALLDVRIGADVVYRFSPADPAMERVVAGLAEAYTENRTEVLDVVASRRRRSLRDFSDAFHLKRRRNDRG